MRLGLAPPHAPTKNAEPVLIWGGSTSVGLYALQFLKASGYTPVSVSSPKSYDLVKKYGAAATFDCKCRRPLPEPRFCERGQRSGGPSDSCLLLFDFPGD